MSVLTVKEVMTTNVISVRHDQDLGILPTVLDLGRFRHLPVIQDGKLVGLVSHRDLLQAQGGQASIAAQIMSSNVKTLGPDAPALEAAELMRDQKIGCIPVVDGDQLVGIVTEADFLDLAIREMSRRD